MIPLRYNLRNLAERRTTSLLTASTVALVAMVVLILLGFVDGLRRTFTRAVAGDTWVVIGRGIISEIESFISHEQFELIRARPEIAVDTDGTPLVSPELVVPFDAGIDRPPDESQFTYLRGVRPVAYKVHRNARIAEGRWPVPGETEVAVGQGLVARFPNLRPGFRFRYARREWTVVGIFDDHGSTRTSEVWTDADTLQQDAHHYNGWASLYLVLRPGSDGAFADAIAADPRFRADVFTEGSFFAQQAHVAEHMRLLVLAVTVVIGIGGVFGGMNTMYGAVARRGREVGVLRALGFTRTNVVASFVAESVLLSVFGGLVGTMAALAIGWLTGLTSQVMRVDRFVFFFHLAPASYAAGLATAVAIGLLGGLTPAFRAASMSIVAALRQL